MASLICPMLTAPVLAAACDSPARDLAFWAFSDVERIMLAISSSEALVSSTEDACSLAPDDKLWLATETWRAAAAVCSAPWSRLLAKPRSKRLVVLEMSHASKAVSTNAAARINRTARSPLSAVTFPAVA